MEPPFHPPATRTFPLGSRVAVWAPRAAAMLPVYDQVPPAASAGPATPITAASANKPIKAGGRRLVTSIHLLADPHHAALPSSHRSHMERPRSGSWRGVLQSRCNWPDDRLRVS